MTGPNTLVNLCQVTTATTGTGTITLGSASSGYRGASALTDGVTYSYSIIDGTAYEEGQGLYTASGTTLARGPVQSSNSNSAINLSGSAIVLVGDALSWDIGLNSPTQPASFASLALTPTPALTLTTDVAQAVGGSVTLPFTNISTAAAGQIVAGTNIPLGAQVSAVIGTVQRTLTANGISASGQKVLTTTNTTNAVVGMIVYDTTTPGAVGAGNTIASIQAGVSITLTSNLTNATVNGDTITLDPVVTLTIASTAAVAAGASITFTTNHTALSAAAPLYTTGDASVNGNLNVGGQIISGQGLPQNGANGGTPASPAFSPGQTNMGMYAASTTYLGFSISGSHRFGGNSSGFIAAPTPTFRTAINNTATPFIQAQNNSATIGNNSLAAFSYRASATVPAGIYLCQSNSSTLGTQTAVASGTRLGDINCEGSDGTNFQDATSIRGLVDGSVSAGVVPGRLEFWTANSGGTLTQALTLDSSQNATFLGVTKSPKLWQSSRNAYTKFTISAPLGATGATKVMMGLGSSWALTPSFSGRVRITVCGYSSSTLATNYGILNVAYGTSTAPTNGAALTGTNFYGSDLLAGAFSATSALPFTLVSEATGLTLSTAYWFDMAVGNGGTGGTTAVTIQSVIIEEF